MCTYFGTKRSASKSHTPILMSSSWKVVLLSLTWTHSIIGQCIYTTILPSIIYIKIIILLSCVISTVRLYTGDTCEHLVVIRHRLLSGLTGVYFGSLLTRKRFSKKTSEFLTRYLQTFFYLRQSFKTSTFDLMVYVNIGTQTSNQYSIVNRVRPFKVIMDMILSWWWKVWVTIVVQTTNREFSLPPHAATISASVQWLMTQ